MSGADIYLWPLFAMLVVGALAATWQARNPATEAAARRKLIARRWELPRWRRMSNWNTYQDQQQNPARIARSGRRRAFVFTGLALAVLAYLLTRS